ncbi:hypothetical protein J437_LFUL016888 [Ladona fulva]|uniref:sn-1-specific diacylglycerol lipase ABHD11 n=1 Tax=Ladona fulva TaxID=123851 RepID=A0A8K0KM33_LADFU|nr:hypothetical protein J437_LFUL016888 [Ladona fulva]
MESCVTPIEMAFTSHDTTKLPPDRAKPPIIAVDARNHGESPHSQDFSYSHLAEDVRLLMEKLNIQQSSLIGHSMGGRAMMLKALKYPHSVEKLIVVDISPVGISPSMGVMKNYFEAMKNVRIENNVTMSAARKTADEQLKTAVPAYECTCQDSMLRLFLTTNLIEENGNYRWRVNLDAISQNFFSHMIEFPPAPPNPFEGPTLFIGGGKSDFLR